jgi:hypothetical protein
MLEQVPINARVSPQAALRLKQLSNRTGRSYGQVLNDLLMGVPEIRADWESPVAQLQERIERLELAIERMQSGSAPLAPQAPECPEPESESVQDAEAPEIGAEAGLTGSPDEPDADGTENRMETKQGVSSHPVPTISPATHTVHEAVDSLIAKGMRSQKKIADALNEAGFRTRTGSLYARSAPVISKSLKAIGW